MKNNYTHASLHYHNRSDMKLRNCLIDRFNVSNTFDDNSIACAAGNQTFAQSFDENILTEATILTTATKIQQ